LPITSKLSTSQQSLVRLQQAFRLQIRTAAASITEVQHKLLV